MDKNRIKKTLHEARKALAETRQLLRQDQNNNHEDTVKKDEKKATNDHK